MSHDSHPVVMLRAGDPTGIKVGEVWAYWDPFAGRGEVGRVTDVSPTWVHTEEWARDKAPVHVERFWYRLTLDAGVHVAMMASSISRGAAKADRDEQQMDQQWRTLREVVGSDRHMLDALTMLAYSGLPAWQIELIAKFIPGQPPDLAIFDEAAEFNAKPEQQKPFHIRVMNRITEGLDRMTGDLR